MDNRQRRDDGGSRKSYFVIPKTEAFIGGSRDLFCPETFTTSSLWSPCNCANVAAAEKISSEASQIGSKIPLNMRIGIMCNGLRSSLEPLQIEGWLDHLSLAAKQR